MKIVYKLSILISIIYIIGLFILSFYIGDKSGVIIFIIGLLPPIILWGLYWILVDLDKNQIKVILTFIAILFSLYFIKNIYDYYKTSKERALLNVSWRMSPDEVEQSNHTKLLDFELKNYLFIPHVADQNRFKFFSQKNILLFENNADIDYVFFDNQLYRYDISFSEITINAASEIFRLLIAKYGNGKELPQRVVTEIQRHEWETDRLDVIFLLIKKTDKTFELGISIIYLPLAKEIEEIAQKEKENYF